MEQLPVFTSSKFRFWAFITVVLLVFVYGCNLHERFLRLWTLPGEARYAALPVTGFYPFKSALIIH